MQHEKTSPVITSSKTGMTKNKCAVFSIKLLATIIITLLKLDLLFPDVYPLYLLGKNSGAPNI